MQYTLRHPSARLQFPLAIHADLESIRRAAAELAPQAVRQVSLGADAQVAQQVDLQASLEVDHLANRPLVQYFKHLL